LFTDKNASSGTVHCPKGGAKYPPKLEKLLPKSWIADAPTAMFMAQKYVPKTLNLYGNIDPNR